MIIFLDTEFTGLGQVNPKLISLGLSTQFGDSFYAELPPDTYLPWADDWVKKNVLCWLWGGQFEMSASTVSRKLVAWIESLQEASTIATDAPQYDFTLIKPLLDPWPTNLSQEVLKFGSDAMGENHQLWLSRVMEETHSIERPEHHALHDANALRIAFLAALDRGWKTP